MSKRYGRNQRRRAREHIASVDRRCIELTAAMLLDRALISHQHEKLEELKSIVSDVGQCMGEYFFGLPPPALRDLLLQRADCRPTFRMMAPDSSVVDMHTLIVANCFSTPEQAMHTMVELAGCRAAYAISYQALLHAPANILARNIAGELGAFLVTEIRKKHRQ